MNEHKNKVVGIWLLIGVGMIFFQVILGGITRLTESGLSITEWDVVSGTLPPLNAAQWNEVFEAYKASPQYELVNQGMNLSQFKMIYFWEYVHRLWARLLGFVFLLPFLFFIVKRYIKPIEALKYLSIFVLGGLQAMVGWIMVKSGLVDMPWVAPGKLTLHLLLASALYILTLRFALEKLTPKETKYYPKFLRGNIYFLLILIIVQISLGGMLAGWKAALTYPTWPTMNGEWVPTDLFVLKPTWKNFLENKATIQFFHRITAYIIIFYVVFIYLKSQSMPVPKLFKRGRHIMLLLAILQVLLGITTLYLSKKGEVPVLFGVLHQACAFLLLMWTVALHYWFKYKEA